VSETGLYAHAIDEARKQPWANPETGHSRAHWARAVGWLAMALVDVAEMVGPKRFAPLAEQAEKLLAEVAKTRQPGGLWLQVMDQPDLEGNYQESSASAMFVYALEKGAQLGLYYGATEGLFDTLVSATVRPKAGGGHEMADICHVAGLGMYEDRFRDGSAEYYLSEVQVADDTKGVGPLMMAAGASLSVQQKENVALAAV
jgi:unsaturated rhamnogalacturonyl hydrolase